MARFEIKTDAAGEFRFNLKAGNGEPILSSEGYRAKSSTLIGIASVRTNSTNDARYDRRVSTAGQPYFVLKAANGEIIGTSEMYSSAVARETGIASVNGNAPTAEVVDLT